MIQSLLRSMELLEVLKEKNRNFSIAELAEAMDLPPSTVHRILQTFCEKKYVIRDDRSHTYRLGPALIPLGKAAARGIRLQDAAHGILAQLAKQTKEDAYLVIPVGNKGLVIEKARSVRSSSHGRHRPSSTNTSKTLFSTIRLSLMSARMTCVRN